MNLAKIQQMDGRLLTRMGQPAIYIAKGAQRTVNTTVLLEEGVDPFADDALTTRNRDLKTVVWMLSAEVANPRRGDQIRVGSLCYDLGEVVKDDGSLILVIVKPCK